MGRAFFLVLVSVWCPALAQKSSPKEATAAPAAPAAQPAQSGARRTDLNLLGKTDTASGESRRNENVQFNLIDNNALKELNVRMGTTATILQEFQAGRGYFGAEFGVRPPAPLHLAPAKASGIHGSLYEWHGNSVFSARSFFQVGDVKPARENEYGASIAAPLWRGGTLSADAGQQKIRGMVNGNVLVPRADERIPLATDPRIRARVERFLAAYPAEPPNRTDINERALNTNSPQRIDDDNAGARLDQALGSRDRLNLRYQFTAQDVKAFQLVAGQNPDTSTRAHTARLTWTREWSPSTLTDFSAGYDRVASLLVPEKNAVGPSVQVGGVIETLGPGSTIPIDRAQNRFRYATQLRQSRGSHNWSAGFDLGRRQTNGTEASSHRGTLQFRNDLGRDAITNFLLGIPSRFSGAIGHVHRGFRNWEMQTFLDDRWAAGANLTIHFGIRYESVTRPVEVDRLDVVPYDCDCNNLAPRAGFAYRLPERWGVLRGAYGLHYGEIFPVTFQQVRFNPPRNQKFEVVVPDPVDPLAALARPSVDPNARSTVFDISPNLVSPYSQQYNFTWELAGTAGWKLQLGYVGSRSHKLLMMWYANRARFIEGVPQITATINDRRPDSRFFDVRRILNGSVGYFDAGRVSLSVPRWRGLSVDGAYWFSKAIDLGAAYTNTASSQDGRQAQSQHEFDVHRDMKGPSPFDQSHSFLLRTAYVTPALPGRGWASRLFGQWDLSTAILVKTGTPFTVVSGSDAPGFGNVDGDSGDRPNLVDPSVLGRTLGHPDTSARLLPRSAFAFIRPTEPRGSLGANTFRKAGIGNVNAALSRSWKVGPERTLTFRAESINFLNTPQFAEPGRELTNPNFGQITNTLNDGRNFRFLLRFSF